MIVPALLDVPCPMCDAVPGELCTALGREMESTVHAPRRVRADVAAPASSSQPRPEGKCKSGRHDWTDENTYEDAGGRRCSLCRLDRQRRRKGPKKPRPLATHCGRGHEFTPANTYTPPNGGTRKCRACKTIQTRADNANRRARKTNTQEITK